MIWKTLLLLVIMFIIPQEVFVHIEPLKTTYLCTYSDASGGLKKIGKSNKIEMTGKPKKGFAHT